MLNKGISLHVKGKFIDKGGEDEDIERGRGSKNFQTPKRGAQKKLLG